MIFFLATRLSQQVPQEEESPMIDIWISNGFVVIYDGTRLMRKDAEE